MELSSYFTNSYILSFEDAIIYCIDFEKCIKALRDYDLLLIHLLARGYNSTELAKMMYIPERTMNRDCNLAICSLAMQMKEWGLLS